mgnify:CR=1 FL=1
MRAGDVQGADVSDPDAMVPMVVGGGMIPGAVGYAVCCAFARRSVALVIPRCGVFAAIRALDHNRAVELPAGKVGDGESAYDAAVREGEEELGVPVAVRVVPLGEFLHRFGGEWWCCTAFLGDLEGAHPRGGPEGEAVWATREELCASTYGETTARVFAAYDKRCAE